MYIRKERFFEAIFWVGEVKAFGTFVIASTHSDRARGYHTWAARRQPASFLLLKSSYGPAGPVGVIDQHTFVLMGTR